MINAMMLKKLITFALLICTTSCTNQKVEAPQTFSIDDYYVEAPQDWTYANQKDLLGTAPFPDLALVSPDKDVVFVMTTLKWRNDVVNNIDPTMVERDFAASMLHAIQDSAMIIVKSRSTKVHAGVKDVDATSTLYIIEDEESSTVLRIQQLNVLHPGKDHAHVLQCVADASKNVTPNEVMCSVAIDSFRMQ